ncbi:HlyD family secretion protein [Hydrogenimonas cancrithermarum]|uniref:Secretion protein HlyD n=1 Tax=Hydrogenimonas cancrithermarum TaxID=2993563 RepID=A0ABM8FHR7_9BACT|nr:HlyD family efflux transporter periplasmic adaptor subunit [Hydrogenimonas cancrithermarum]BDY11809.1 secretion protein HlyD [Hydrogenimonas cancrithermarum]
MERLKKYWLGIVAVLLLGVAAVMIYEKLNPKQVPSNLVEGVGRIDGDLVDLNVKYPGRLEQVAVEDGMPIKKGDIVARLKSLEYEAKLAQVTAQLRAKQKELNAKKTELNIAKKTIPLALRRADSARKTRRAQLQELEKSIEAQKRVVEQDDRDYERTKNLYEKRLIQKELLEKAALKRDTDRDRLAALGHKREQLRAAIEIAEADFAEAKAAQRKIDALEEGIEALREGVQAMKDARGEVEAVLEEMTIRSPIDGFVVEKIANAGEVLGAGMPVASLIDPHSLYLKIFVDTIQNGKIKIGDKAVIFLDSWPDRPIEAKVVRIAQNAEFTPKEVSVRSDRIQRVYALHLKPLKVDPLLKLGLPAIGVVSLDGKGLPKSLRELPPL